MYLINNTQGQVILVIYNLFHREIGGRTLRIASKMVRISFRETYSKQCSVKFYTNIFCLLKFFDVVNGMLLISVNYF